VIGFVGLLRDGFVPLRRDNSLIYLISIRVEYRLLLIHLGNLGPQLCSTFSTAIPHVRRNHLASLRIHGDPDPLPIDLLRDKAPHLISFSSCTTTSAGPAGGWTCKRSGQAAKRSLIKYKSHVRLTPTARQIPRKEMRSRHRYSMSVRCSSAMKRSYARHKLAAACLATDDAVCHREYARSS
jgi:hypothetical protein